MIKRLFILILSLTLPILLLGVSVFSFSGMPETYAGRDIYGIGMGDTGVGNLLRANNSAKNASLSCQNLYATFATGIYFGNVNIKDKNSDTSFNGEISYLPYFSLSVPIYKNRIGISYQAIANGKFTAEDFNMNDSDISEIRKADNSIYQVDLFYAYKFEKLNIGLAINYFFGHRTEYTRADLGDPNLINPKYEVEESYTSPGFTMSFSKLMNESFSLGGAFSVPAKLNGEKTFKTITTNEKMDDSTFEMPFRASLGAAMALNKNTHVSFDFDYDMWSKSNVYHNADDGYRIAFGIDYENSQSNKNFISKTGQRFGAAYRVSPLSSINANSHNLNEYSFSYGFSLPIKTRESYIDIAVKYFNRSSNQTEFEENGIIFSIGTSGFDILKKPLNRKGHRDIPKADDVGLY